jgi:integrase
MPGGDGKSHEYRKAGFKTEAQGKKALRLLREQKGAQNLGLLPLMAPRQDRIRVNELLDDLVAEYRKGGKKGIPREPDRPMLSHLKRLRNYFGGMRAVDAPRHIEAFISFLQGKIKANATINRATQLLEQAFAIAAAASPPKVLRPLKIRKLDESGNVRKGKFTEREAEAVASSLPACMSDAARFAYEVGSHSGEILQLRWDYLEPEGFRVSFEITKNREQRIIALTPRLDEIITRRLGARVQGCPLVFHHDGKPITNYLFVANC